jgi:hypothetical protein
MLSWLAWDRFAHLECEIVVTALMALFVGIFLAGLVGLAFIFVLRPIYEFFELREAVKHRTAKLKNGRAAHQQQRDYSAALRRTLRREEARYLLAAQREFRELAFQMGALAHSYRLATWLLRKMKLDPAKAAAGLSNLADAISPEHAEIIAIRARNPDLRAFGT